MSQSDLIPLTSARAHEIGKLGGRVSSPEKRYANIIKNSTRAKCKSCKALCFLKKENISMDAECLCPIPKVRAYSIFYQMPVMDENVLLKLESESLVKMVGICQKPSEIKMLIDAIDRKKQTDYPKVNRNMNINVEATLKLGEKEFDDLYGRYEKARTKNAGIHRENREDKTV